MRSYRVDRRFYYDAPKKVFSYLSKLGAELGIKLCPCCGCVLEQYCEFELRIACMDVFVCVNPSCKAFRDGACFR